MSELLYSNHGNIPWVLCIDSGKKWPIVGIIACTHWWETVWLEIIDYLLHTLWIQKKLLKWKIYFILSNIKAYEKSLELKKKWVAGYMMESRYVEENMNRCCSVVSLNNPINYERKRANELSQIVKKLDIIIDIHSTTHPSGSMIIHTIKSNKYLWKFTNTDDIYIDFIKYMTGKPLMDITNRAWWMALCIETWCQLDAAWYKVWLDNIYRILTWLRMIQKREEDKKMLLSRKKNKKYKVIWSVFIHDITFKPIKKFTHLEKIKKWSILAYEYEKPIYAEKDCLVIMPAEHKPGEEYCFLVKPLLSIKK